MDQKVAKIGPKNDQTPFSGFSKPIGFGELCFAPWTLVVFVISVLAVMSANPAINPLACGCLSCLHHFRHFRDSRRFREKHRIANIGLAKPRFRNTRLFSQTEKTHKENLHKEFRRDPGRGVKEWA